MSIKKFFIFAVVAVATVAGLVGVTKVEAAARSTLDGALACKLSIENNAAGGFNLVVNQTGGEMMDGPSGRMYLNDQLVNPSASGAWPNFRFHFPGMKNGDRFKYKMSDISGNEVFCSPIPITAVIPQITCNVKDSNGNITDYKKDSFNAGGNIVFEISASGGSGNYVYSWRKDGGTYSSESYFTDNKSPGVFSSFVITSVITSFNTSGLHSVYVRVNDKKSLLSSYAYCYARVKAVEPPVLVNPPDATFFGKTYATKWNGVSFDKFEYKLVAKAPVGASSPVVFVIDSGTKYITGTPQGADGSYYLSFNDSYLQNLTRGKHTWAAQIPNAKSEERTFYIDKTAPTCSLIMGNVTGTAAQYNVYLDVYMFDDDGGVGVNGETSKLYLTEKSASEKGISFTFGNWTKDFKISNSNPLKIYATGVKDGSLYRFTVEDVLGNGTSCGSGVVRTPNVAPKVTLESPLKVSCEVTSSPTTYTGVLAGFKSTVSGGSGIYSYNWFVGNDLTKNTLSDYYTSFLIAGKKEIIVEVTSTVNGIMATEAAGCTVNVLLKPVVTKKATVDLRVNDSDGPITVKAGTWVNLTWESKNADATYCVGSGGGWVNGVTGINKVGLTNLSPGNNVKIDINRETRFTITCGSATDSVIVNMIPDDPLKVSCEVTSSPTTYTGVLAGFKSTVSGGSGNYSYFWSGGDNNSTRNNSSYSTYFSKVAERKQVSLNVKSMVDGKLVSRDAFCIVDVLQKPVPATLVNPPEGAWFGNGRVIKRDGNSISYYSNEFVARVANATADTKAVFVIDNGAKYITGTPQGADGSYHLNFSNSSLQGLKEGVHTWAVDALNVRSEMRTFHIDNKAPGCSLNLSYLKKKTSSAGYDAVLHASIMDDLYEGVGVLNDYSSKKLYLNNGSNSESEISLSKKVKDVSNGPPDGNSLDITVTDVKNGSWYRLEVSDALGNKTSCRTDNLKIGEEKVVIILPPVPVITNVKAVFSGGSMELPKVNNRWAAPAREMIGIKGNVTGADYCSVNGTSAVLDKESGVFYADIKMPTAAPVGAVVTCINAGGRSDKTAPLFAIGLPNIRARAVLDSDANTGVPGVKITIGNFTKATDANGYIDFIPFIAWANYNISATPASGYTIASSSAYNNQLAGYYCGESPGVCQVILGGLFNDSYTANDQSSDTGFVFKLRKIVAKPELRDLTATKEVASGGTINVSWTGSDLPASCAASANPTLGGWNNSVSSSSGGGSFPFTAPEVTQETTYKLGKTL